MLTTRYLDLELFGTLNFFLCPLDILQSLRLKSRSSRLYVFCREGALKNFAKFTGKHQCQRPFFKKVAGLLRKRLWNWCFPVNLAKFLRTPFLTEHLRWLLLEILLLISNLDMLNFLLYQTSFSC